jgi:streptogramin lyase
MIQRMLLMTLVVAVGFAAIGVGESAGDLPLSVTVWDMPLDAFFPAGLAVEEGGFVFVAASGDLSVIRLDPTDDVYRLWGVGDGPEDVLVVDGVAFSSVGRQNLLVFFHPGGLSTSSYTLPVSGLGLREIHRGPDSADGEYVFWIAARHAPGVVRAVHDPATNPTQPSGSPYETPAARRVIPVSPRTAASGYEAFSYDLRAMLSPEPLTPSLSGGIFTGWTLPVEDQLVEDIAVCSDGKVWISAGLPVLFRLDPVAETLQAMETIQNVRIFQGLLPDPDGSIWFGNILEGAIGHFDPDLGVSETWRIPGVEEIYDLAFDPYGRIWFTDRQADAIGVLDTTTGEATIYPLPSNSEPLYLAITSSGDVWFTAGSGNFVGRLSMPTSPTEEF